MTKCALAIGHVPNAVIWFSRAILIAGSVVPPSLARRKKSAMHQRQKFPEERAMGSSLSLVIGIAHNAEISSSLAILSAACAERRSLTSQSQALDPALAARARY